MKTFLLATVAVLGMAHASQAALMYTETNTLPAGPYTAPTPTSCTGCVVPANGTSVDGEYRSPFQNTSEDGQPYLAVESTGVATFDVTGNKLSLIWGSPDSYNQLSFYSGVDGKGTLLGTISGNQVIVAPNQAGQSFSYVTAFGFDQDFNSIQLLNNPQTNAFEVSSFNVSQVPIPASLPMFGGALIGLAGLVLFRNRNGSHASKSAISAA